MHADEQDEDDPSSASPPLETEETETLSLKSSNDENSTYIGGQDNHEADDEEEVEWEITSVTHSNMTSHNDPQLGTQPQIRESPTPPLTPPNDEAQVSQQIAEPTLVDTKIRTINSNVNHEDGDNNETNKDQTNAAVVQQPQESSLCINKEDKQNNLINSNSVIGDESPDRHGECGGDLSNIDSKPQNRLLSGSEEGLQVHEEFAVCEGAAEPNALKSVVQTTNDDLIQNVTCCGRQHDSKPTDLISTQPQAVAKDDDHKSVECSQDLDKLSAGIGSEEFEDKHNINQGGLEVFEAQNEVSAYDSKGATLSALADEPAGINAGKPKLEANDLEFSKKPIIPASDEPVHGHDENKAHEILEGLDKNEKVDVATTQRVDVEAEVPDEVPLQNVDGSSNDISQEKFSRVPQDAKSSYLQETRDITEEVPKVNTLGTTCVKHDTPDPVDSTSVQESAALNSNLSECLPTNEQQQDQQLNVYNDNTKCEIVIEPETNPFGIEINFEASPNFDHDNNQTIIEFDRQSCGGDDYLELEFDQEPAFEPRNITVKRQTNLRDEYELGDELGRGRFGAVYRCTETSTSRELAVKFVHTRHTQDRQDVEREVAIMCELQHKRLLQLYDAFDDGVNEMCLVTELVEGGELFERIVDDDFELTEKKAAIFMRQICEGTEYMHFKNIVHLDLKPENILCVSKTGNRIKLIDFGLARQLKPNEPLRVMFGTPDFAAPEVLSYDTISLATDMWSVGVICYVLLSGLSPFMGESDLETMANVMKGTYDFNDDSFDLISDLAKDFIEKLLVKSPFSRLTPRGCLEHAWLQKGGAKLEAAVRTRRESVVSLGKDIDLSSLNELSLSKRKLKRYVVRRRWQKAVHAITALRRLGAKL